MDRFRAALEGGRPLVLDGGLATMLEARGHALDDPLWSAKLLLEAPDEVRAVHRAFLEAGADVIATVSYQASFEGLVRRGLADDAAAELLRLSVRLAGEARDAYWSESGHRRDEGRRPLVAASVGPYGAVLADGSEYTGDYALDDDELLAFHRRRWHVLAAAGPDLMACETIPSRREVDVLVRLAAETPHIGTWISFSTRDARHLADGSPLAEAAGACAATPSIVAVGVNCLPPSRVTPALRELRGATALPLLAYPNSGERWLAGERRWADGATPVDWAAKTEEWVALGARGIGGCCRVGAETVREVRRALVP